MDLMRLQKLKEYIAPDKERIKQEQSVKAQRNAVVLENLEAQLKGAPKPLEFPKSRTEARRNIRTEVQSDVDTEPMSYSLARD